MDEGSRKNAAKSGAVALSGERASEKSSDTTSFMSHDSDGTYRCPKCGATSALLLPEPVLRESHVTLKCLQCAHVVQVPRQALDGAVSRFDSTRSRE
jgi:hypothetical protein